MRGTSCAPGAWLSVGLASCKLKRSGTESPYSCSLRSMHWKPSFNACRSVCQELASSFGSAPLHICHGCALYIPLQHQPISSGPPQCSGVAAPRAQIGDLVAVVPRFVIPTSETSCPRINRGPSPSCQRNVRNTSPKSVRSRAASIRRLGA